jgi:hypothetical protein
MELTSSADVLRVAKDGTQFFVNGEPFTFFVTRPGLYSAERCYLLATADIDKESQRYVRVEGQWRALANSREELIEALKRGVIVTETSAL